MPITLKYGPSPMAVGMASYMAGAGPDWEMLARLIQTTVLEVEAASARQAEAESDEAPHHPK